MSFYISNRQLRCGSPRNKIYVPMLLERPETALQHRVYTPEFALAHLLLDAYELTNSNKNELHYPVLPTPNPCIYFKFNRTSGSAVLCGATTEIKKIVLPPQFTVFCVRLQPGIIGALINQSAKVLTNVSAPLDHYFLRTSQLINQVRIGESFHERNVRIQYYMNENVNSRYSPPSRILSNSLTLIQKMHGNMKISELAKVNNCSERYVGRIFQDAVGISPKTYCEIVRMQASLNEILTTKPKSLIQIAIAYGYFDQPHMNRAYQKLLGRTASDMRFFDDITCGTSDIPIII